ncbi:MAG: TIGR04282 family arsenosugar biosynthesis glycosyltransferase [Sulfuritalea sp.]|nr:TIGR04282 family arsenosugar biosynthesis glycosyltransferase [Sulfuritalea sp.]
MNSRVGVAILARAPIPGQAKTRLIPALGADGAARLQRWMLQRTVAMALVADVGPVSLWCAGDPSHRDFAVCRAFGQVTLRRQPEGDLGERMLAAVVGSAASAGTLVIGTDCPALSSTHLRNAAKALGEGDAVVIPAEDGGYVLIGMKTPAPEIFAGVDWGSDRVMAQTRKRLATIGWCWNEPDPLWDVDLPRDLERLYSGYPDAMTTRGDTGEFSGQQCRSVIERRELPDGDTPRHAPIRPDTVA